MTKKPTTDHKIRLAAAKAEAKRPAAAPVGPATATLRAADRVTARTTRHVTDRAMEYGLKSLSELELRSVYALFAWVANQQSAAEETVRCLTEIRFGIDDVTHLKQRDYEEVIKFLVDLRIDEMKN